MRVAWMLQIAVVLFSPPAWYAWRHRDEPRRALSGAALVLTGMYAAFFAMFAIGETFTDPGGWAAVGSTAAWLVPLVVLGWRRPRAAGLMLLALACLPTALSLLDAPGPGTPGWGIAVVTLPAAIIGGLHLVAASRHE